MATSSDNYKSNPGTQLGLFQAIMGTVENLITRLIRLLTLTEDEQAKAGIYLGGEGRDFDQGDE